MNHGGVILYTLHSPNADIVCIPVQEGTIFVRVRFRGNLCPLKGATNAFIDYLTQMIGSEISQKYLGDNCRHQLSLNECVNLRPGKPHCTYVFMQATIPHTAIIN